MAVQYFQTICSRTRCTDVMTQECNDITLSLHQLTHDPISLQVCNLSQDGCTIALKPFALSLCLRPEIFVVSLPMSTSMVLVFCCRSVCPIYMCVLVCIHSSAGACTYEAVHSCQRCRVQTDEPDISPRILVPWL